MDGPSSYTGVQSGDIVITYQMIQQDVRDAIHWSHTEVYSYYISLLSDTPLSLLG